jgi:LytS/YehU family sensor histidine kinase
MLLFFLAAMTYPLKGGLFTPTMLIQQIIMLRFFLATIVETFFFSAGTLSQYYRQSILYRILEQEKQQFKRLANLSEMNSLRAQLSPHFVQNTFDLIATSTRLGNIEETVDVINRVSSYLRNLLNNSNASVITIEEEMLYAEEYLKMQQLINPGLFTYSITITESVDTIGVYIPSLTIQPILENCIIHGFQKASRNGKINIHIEQQNNEILIIVYDNGGGLISSKKNTVTRKSYGIELSKKRLLLLYNNAENITVKTENRKDGFSGALTLVKFPAYN